MLKFFQSSIFTIKVPGTGMSPDEIYFQVQEKLKELYQLEPPPVTIDTVTPVIVNEPPAVTTETAVITDQVSGTSSINENVTAENENQPEPPRGPLGQAAAVITPVDNKCCCLIS